MTTWLPKLLFQRFQGDSMREIKVNMVNEKFSLYDTEHDTLNDLIMYHRTAAVKDGVCLKNMKIVRSLARVPLHLLQFALLAS